MTQNLAYAVGALLAVKTYDGPVEIRRVTSYVQPGPAEASDYVQADSYLSVPAERVDGSDAYDRPEVASAPRGGIGPETEEVLAQMGYTRAADWQAHGYARAWSALLAQTQAVL